MPDQTVEYVSAGKPKVAGAIYSSKNGALPTDATSSLASEYACAGYISEDGLVNSNSPTVTTVKAWGGTQVLVTSSEKPDTFKFKMIEALNTNALKIVYGEANVTGSIDDMISIKANNNEADTLHYVVDMILRGGVLKRIVIPNGMISAVSDIVYKDNDVIAYEVTISGMPDAQGNTHYEYISKGE